MFFDHDILGEDLPHGTLCLTFDDGPGRTDGPGPGPHTAALGAFLHAEGIPATFFVTGKAAAQHAPILAELRSRGHCVASHTYDHPSLPAFVAGGGDVVDQLVRTERAIRQSVADGPIYFRAPYGDWRLIGEARSNVAAVLNRSPLRETHVGPIGWDIDAGDVGFWRDDRSPLECAQAYLDAVERTGRGIVLMHDSTADIDAIRRRNQALALVRHVVPELRRRGYRFVSLDDVPQAAEACAQSRCECAE